MELKSLAVNLAFNCWAIFPTLEMKLRGQFDSLLIHQMKIFFTIRYIAGKCEPPEGDINVYTYILTSFENAC